MLTKMTTSPKTSDLPESRWVLVHGRLVLLLVILLGFVASCGAVLLFIHNDTLSWDNGGKSAIEYILGAFGPSLGIISAHYFSERATRIESGAASTEAFVFALSITILTSISPLIVFALIEKFDVALAWMKAFGTVTQALSAGAIAYYFANGLRRPVHPGLTEKRTDREPGSIVP
jgi:hypothetical protein